MLVPGAKDSLPLTAVNREGLWSTLDSFSESWPPFIIAAGATAAILGWECHKIRARRRAGATKEREDERWGLEEETPKFRTPRKIKLQKSRVPIVLYGLIRAVRGNGVGIERLLVDCSAHIKVESNDNE